MSDPVFRLGHSRTASRVGLTVWEQIRGWFHKAPASPRPNAIPRPPRSVLRARTMAELTEEPPDSRRGGSSKRR